MKIKAGEEEKYAEYKQVNSADPYSKAVVDYSERWAGLMEARMEKGEKLSDVAGETSHEADTDGITGFMYGCAVQGLAWFWEHGEELRRWHNLQTQVGNEGERANEEGGVLNPAIMTIEGGINE